MTDSPTPRLFVALWPDAAVRAGLVALRDTWTWPPGARPVADENLHLTLHFIGSFPRERIDPLGCALAAIVPREPTRLIVKGTDLWRGGVAVLTLRAEPGLVALQADIGRALSTLGVTLDERPFAPHVTMARKARGARPPAAHPELGWQANGFALVESRGGARPDYRVLATWRAAQGD
ncbi:MAG: RNA 2',3'-cyclic phosphodiesterase [Caldimonas sp.]